MRENTPPHFQVIVQATLDWWDAWVELAVINIIWVFGWLTLIFGPPATLGVFYVTNQLAHGKSVGLKGFLEAGKRYFGVSWMWLLVNLIAAVIFLANFYFYASLDSVLGEILKAVFVILGCIWLIVQFYALPYLIEAEHNRIGIALRNGLFTILAAPFYTLIVITPAALVAGVSIKFVFLVLLGVFCWIALLGNHAVIERLKAYQVREREQANTPPFSF